MLNWQQTILWQASKKAHKCLIETTRNHDYTKRILLDDLYYNLIRIDLSRQKNTTILQQVNFTGKLEEDDGDTIFLYQKYSKRYSKLFFRFSNCSRMMGH